MNTKEMPVRELRERALKVLAKELGPVGLIRFLQDCQTGKGDYTKDRERWLRGVRFEDVAQRIRSRRKGSRKTKPG
jgi:hypothetical protein